MTPKTKLLTRVGSFLGTAIICVACGGGGGASSGSTSTTTTVSTPPPVTVTPPAPTTPTTPASGAVTISGSVTFDDVPANSVGGLNFSAIVPAPIRGVTIEAVDAGDNIIEAGQTGLNGEYSLSVPVNTPVRIRVKAEMIQTTGTTWNVRVQDNTNGDALYAFQGALVSSGAVDSIRDLNAASGFGTTSFTGTRVAAPFAILDPIFDTLQAFAAVAPGTDFPETDFNWSEDNTTVFGDTDDGEIGTSSYFNGTGQIFILGEENVDTDEFDEDVVVHEWGHYFFSFNVENQPLVPNDGWFSETSVQEIIYDIFDGDDDAGDTVSLGLGPIFDAMTSTAYTESPVFTTIFTFMDAVIDQNSGDTAGLTALLTQQSINGSGPTGVGETNSGGITETLPVYKVATINGPPVVVCSSNDTGPFNASPDFNGHGVRDYITFTRTSITPVTMTAQIIPSLSSNTNVDPDFFVFSEGVPIAQAISAPSEEPPGTETLTNSFLQNQTGNLVIEIFDFNNVDETLQELGLSNDGDSCYNFTITQ